MDSLLEFLDTSSISSESIKSLFTFYEALKSLKIYNNSSQKSLVPSIPSFSLNAIDHCLKILRQDPNISLTEAISRSFPLGCFLTSEKLGNFIFPQVVEAFQATVNDTRKRNSPVNLSTTKGGFKSEYNNLLDHQEDLCKNMKTDLQLGNSICLLGFKVSYNISTLPLL